MTQQGSAPAIPGIPTTSDHYNPDNDILFERPHIFPVNPKLSVA